MNRSILPEIILDVLLKKYRLSYIFLIGSRARGDYSQNSDYDIVGFCDAKYFRLSGDYFYINEKFIDITIYKNEALEDLKSFINIKPEFIDAVAVYGEHNKTKKILKRVREEYDKGPLIYEEDKIAAIAWLKRLVSRLKNEPLDIIYNYRFKRYSVFILSSYFWVRGLWYHCPKRAFEWLEQNDHKSYEAFKKVYQNDPNIEDLDNLVKLIVERDRD